MASGGSAGTPGVGLGGTQIAPPGDLGSRPPDDSPGQQEDGTSRQGTGGDPPSRPGTPPPNATGVDPFITASPATNTVAKKRHLPKDPDLLASLQGAFALVKDSADKDRKNATHAMGSSSMRAGALKDIEKLLLRAISLAEAKASSTMEQALAAVTSQYDALSKSVEAIQTTLAANPSPTQTSAQLSYAHAAKSSLPKKYSFPAVALNKALSLTLHQKDPKKPVLAEASTADVYKKIAAAIDLFPPITITGLRKHAGSKDWVIILKSKEDVELLSRNTQWINRVDPGLEIRQQLFGVVVHRVPTLFDMNDPDQRKHFIDENPALRAEPNVVFEWLGSQTAEATTRRQAKKHSSIIVKFRSAENANTAIYNAIKFRHEMLPTYKSMDPLLQCYKCHSYGHTAKACSKKPACSLCANEHPTDECPHQHCNEEEPCAGTSSRRPCQHFPAPSCANCRKEKKDDNHRVTDPACPARKAALSAAKAKHFASGDLFGERNLDDSAQ
jgi:hypothetical protein